MINHPKVEKIIPPEVLGYFMSKSESKDDLKRYFRAIIATIDTSLGK
jgi:hypothetical protein